MRGKLISVSSLCVGLGITPAHAGKTRNCPPFSACSGDHPRVCGENHLPEHIGRIREGSPPRVRGKQELDKVQAHVLGITPACAGKTASVCAL